MELNPMEVLFMFLGGLGIFLYGIKSMGDGLQAAAGDRLREILNRMTTNPFLGVLAGIIITALLQSSSGTTAITIGLVSAGFMTLRQAIGVIMGANIGTTITAFVIGLDIGAYSLPILAFGVILLFFFKAPKINNYGRIIFGFGALFYGLELMGDGVRPLADLQGFSDLMLMLSDNPILGFAVGTVLTVIVQSSSATIAILQNFYMNDLVDLTAAMPILLGDNVGTTITAVLAALVGTIAARRAAAVHVVFNLFGAIIFMLILPFFTMFVGYLETALDLNGRMTIAFAHGSYNLVNTLIHLPLIGFLAWVVTKLVPGKDYAEDYQPVHLDKSLMKQSPSIALQGTQKEIQNLGQLTLSMLEDARDFTHENDAKIEKRIREKAGVVDGLTESIRKYLQELSKYDISNEDAIRQTTLLEINRMLYKVSEQIVEFTDLNVKKYNKNIYLSESAQKGLNDFIKHVGKSFRKAVNAIDIYNPQDVEMILDMTQKSTNIENKLRKQHVKRMNKGICSTDGGHLYVDLISTLERIGYNTRNITELNLGDDGSDTEHEEEQIVFDQ
ncbi:Na/Pi cotransporter family protein [Salinicoccus halitifaciens]|uniref:Phosphate:Na+ symporter n=1 Tax=Salinicoccus halitifaciens TaxID=1073415 RepID=A0ABV2E9U1_9STAP|nr:Na/Pi cotransporter family protein [Salinicoccus halitifaciens]MCD2138048.1 Na/Pi cotransporter family protein [Salinicoccus halitifaciens]